jgi:hypothetical protein
MNPVLDDLIAGYLRTVPVNERIDVMGGILHILADRVVTLGLWYTVTPGAVANRIVSVSDQWPSNAMGWNAWVWDLAG